MRLPAPRVRLASMPQLLALVALALAACHAAPPPATPPVTPLPDAAPAMSKLALDNQRACEAGDAWGCTTIGVFYQLGDEAERVPVDPPKAAGYLERGCTGKVPEACALLIQLYQGGAAGVPQDLARVDALRTRCARTASPGTAGRRRPTSTDSKLAQTVRPGTPSRIVGPGVRA